MIEVCTRTGCFVHLLKTNIHTYMTIFSYNVSLLSLYVHSNLTIMLSESYSLLFLISLHYVGCSCLSNQPFHSAGGHGFDHHAHSTLKLFFLR